MKSVFASRWAQFVYALLLVGLVVIVWIWRVRAPDAAVWQPELWSAVDQWGRRVTSLGWVNVYQTVLAGALAVAAGAFVLAVNRLEVAERRRAEREAKVARTVSAFRSIIPTLVSAELAFRIQKAARPLPDPGPTLRALPAELSIDFPDFHTAVVASAQELEAALDVLRQQRAGKKAEDFGFDTQRIFDMASAMSIALRYYAVWMAVHVGRTGTFDMQQIPFGPAKKHFDETKVPARSARGVAFLFTDYSKYVPEEDEVAE